MNVEKTQSPAQSAPDESQTAAPAPRNTRLRSFAWPVLFVLLAACFPAYWHMKVTRGFSPEALAVMIMLCGASLAWGRLFFRVAASCLDVTPGFSAQFLCGFFILNTSCFLLCFAAPLTIATWVLILSALGFLSLLLPSSKPPPVSTPADYLPEFLCLLLAGLAATLWCTDSLAPYATNGKITVFRMWTDAFFHTRQISGFAQAHGLAHVPNIQMAGAPTTVYHYACYVTPAAIVSLTGTNAYELMAGFLAPFGLLLTGLAAFVLMSAVWGKWPGLASLVAVLLMPDAFQQGFQNKMMSYNFLQQVNPGGLYGVALIAAGWMFMLNACKTGKWPAILFAYGITLVSVVYKAQLFVANSWLMMMYPCFFFRPVKPAWRALAGIGLTGLFITVAGFAQRLPSVPTMRLDGSGIPGFTRLLLVCFDPGWMKTFYFTKLPGEVPPAFHLIAAGMILITTFGIWLPLCVALFFTPRARPERPAQLFPLLVIVNYIVMAVFLALDRKKIGMPEELLHRPLVWAYFAVVAWTGAALYVCIAGRGLPKNIFARVAAGAVAVLSLSVPVYFHHNLQTMPAWPGYARFPEFNLMMAAFPQSAAYIREHSQESDIIQDSENDSNLALSALAERQDFIAYSPVNALRVPPGVHERVATLNAFKEMSSRADIEKFARENGISWYLLHPETQVKWPASFTETAVYQYEGFRLYHFKN